MDPALRPDLKFCPQIVGLAWAVNAVIRNSHGHGMGSSLVALEAQEGTATIATCTVTG